MPSTPKIATLVTLLMCLLAVASASGNMCGAKCGKDADCFQGGFVQCSKCNLIAETLGYKPCYDPNPPATPEPTQAPTTPSHNYFPKGGSCKNKCSTNRDCRVGGFNPCGQCGSTPGTQMYGRCFRPEPTPTPKPKPAEHKYFPKGGSCKKSCKANNDCQNGGFNPCGKCGGSPGTQMYQRCYQPEGSHRRRLRVRNNRNL